MPKIRHKKHWLSRFFGKEANLKNILKQKYLIKCFQNLP